MSKTLAIFLVICSTFFWGSNFNVGKYVVGEMSPLIATALRFSLASLVIIIITIIKEKNFFQMLKENIIIYILLGFIGVAGFNSFFLIGLKHSSAINCALIMSTNPLLTNIFAKYILKKEIFTFQKIGMIISFVGVLLILTQGSLDTLLKLKFSAGDWIIIIGNICWALYGVLCLRYLKNSSALATTASTMFFGTLVLIILAFFEGNVSQVFQQNISIYSAIAYMGICGAVLAYLFWNTGVAKLGAGTTSLFFNFVPVFTVLISILLGHPVLMIQILGGAIILLGVLTSSNFIRIPLKTKRST
ncbi:DMT family transporter [Fluviispira multicolorata]|uniref:EamA family transporter n=1 Tax=Fluviispira multicolorata TaxID=2654512 RepID=A0A833JBI9_9BACT|nr:DMT family transporter [Fluviispira multicolorata]KAB8028584.1 EamA family transporter [Fluviispira multicolorata]